MDTQIVRIGCVCSDPLPLLIETVHTQALRFANSVGESIRAAVFFFRELMLFITPRAIKVCRTSPDVPLLFGPSHFVLTCQAA